jgi:hypothetical protein
MVFRIELRYVFREVGTEFINIILINYWRINISCANHIKYIEFILDSKCTYSLHINRALLKLTTEEASCTPSWKFLPCQH